VESQPYHPELQVSLFLVELLVFLSLVEPLVSPPELSPFLSRLGFL